MRHIFQPTASDQAIATAHAQRLCANNKKYTLYKAIPGCVAELGTIYYMRQQHNIKLNPAPTGIYWYDHEYKGKYFDTKCSGYTSFISNSWSWEININIKPFPDIYVLWVKPLEHVDNYEYIGMITREKAHKYLKPMDMPSAGNKKTIHLADIAHHVVVK